ncbi:Gfo/Idh/MocA family oxidoreductase [Asinibacterium sp. OR53]|uniref:Gfo/Idh/MocA family oxidoreductase n=1 Tax=Asinibacterium sp. OR53 TaxID=925409 RepID=UPI00068616D7|nr:Gfo/Idh/MocA family oxidoreductase [Asinibacterium sp. OR53]
MIKLGILGMSEGNGHPYSWSAIFNGYKDQYMKDCPFPAIYNYLKKQHFPDDTINEATVTHIWTADRLLSEHIANASEITHISDKYEDMIGHVDGVLLARDDAENHYEMSKPFIEAGLPIYIDKPIAYDVPTAERILHLKRYDHQIFSCTSLRYAKEFMIDEQISKKVGVIKFIDAEVPKSWNKYAIHVIEPILQIIGFDVDVLKYNVIDTNEGKIVTIVFSKNITCVIKAITESKSPISILLSGNNGFHEMVFENSFEAFKTSLKKFINVIKKAEENIPIKETLKVVDIIQKGNILV